jgi:Co/Zn/Cd efflux system component
VAGSLMGHDHEHSHCDAVAHDRRILWVVLLLNSVMFYIELRQGLKASSSSLIADSMDFFSDSLSYIITLFVMGMHIHIRAKAAIFKASFMLLLAAMALIQGIINLYEGIVPASDTMGMVGLLALIVNIISATLLFGSRGRDSNMRSVWLCSRNDMIANIMIIIAAYFVGITDSLVPDLLVALGIAWLEGSAALKIIRHAKKELKS